MTKIYEQYRKEISNRERFVRFAERRVNRILDALDKLGDCSNRRKYDYSDSDMKNIFGKIENKVKESKIMFESNSGNRKGEQHG